MAKERSRRDRSTPRYCRYPYRAPDGVDARALGIAIPAQVMAVADDVIEWPAAAGEI